MLPIQKINERLENSIRDSDTLYFLDLMLAGEQLLKIVTAGLVACVTDDNKRHRYSQEYRLLRADGIGEWSSVIDEMLTGISSQFFNPVVNHLQRELIERLGFESWQFKSIEELIKCLQIVDSSTENISAKVSGKTWFSLFAHLRNKTKGHGAYPSETYSKICVPLSKSIKYISENYSLVANIEWVYLHRNLSGKYKVSNI